MNLKVVSFNIRYTDDPDGHSICERAPRLAECILPIAPDVIGIQEFTPAWEEHINKSFGKEYEIFNKYRAEDNKESGPILWRKDKFECIKTGYFWLSDTPEVESKGWDEVCGCHRICVYAILKERQTNEYFTFMNTHFGFGDNGQIKSVELIYDYSKKISAYPTFITGDFNMSPKSVAYEAMIKHFTDVNAVTANDLRNTFHGYKTEGWGVKEHIDFCFVSDNIKPINQKLIEKTFGGKFPSDHYGLEIDIEI